MNAPVAHAPMARAFADADPSDLDRLLARPFMPSDLMRGDNLDRLERIADRLSNGRMTVPEYLRGNPGDCMAIAMQAMLWGMDPFVVAQKTHIVSGRLGYEAQLVIAVVMNSGAIRGSFHYEFRGESNSLECRVGAVLRGESEVTWGEWLQISSITTKNSPLWKVNPKQQMGYLQAKNWARIYCPGAILGVYTIDELEDFVPPPRTSSDTPRKPPELPAYADDAFAANLPKWRNLVESGRKTPADLLATLQTKATFSGAQADAILALGAKPAAEPETDKPAADSRDEWVTDLETGEIAK